MTTKRGQQKQARKRMTSCETGYLRLRVVSKIISPMTHITGVQRSYCQEHLDQDTLYCLRALLTLDWCFNYIVLRWGTGRGAAMTNIFIEFLIPSPNICLMFAFFTHTYCSGICNFCLDNQIKSDISCFWLKIK